MTINEIKIECIKRGISLTQLCRNANIHRSILTRWEQKPPRYVEVMERLESELKKLAVKGKQGKPRNQNIQDNQDN